MEFGELRGIEHGARVADKKWVHNFGGKPSWETATSVTEKEVGGLK